MNYYGDKIKMNEEELFCRLFPEYVVNGKPLSPYFDLFESGFEQAEKRIEELKADNDARKFAMAMSEKVEKQLREENAELKEKLKTAYRKGMRHMAKALKDYDRTDGAWTDYFEHTVDKVLQREQLDFEEYGTLADQLTKAKEIIKKLISLNRKEWIYSDVREEAEQFLNSEVGK